MLRDVYSGYLKLRGEEHEGTIITDSNLADSLMKLERIKEAKSVLRKMVPVARRVLGENQGLTLKMRSIYAQSLYGDPAAMLADLREAGTTLEEMERTARRVLGGAHPLTVDIGKSLRESREALSAREVSSLGDAMAAMTPQDAQDPSS